MRKVLNLAWKDTLMRFSSRTEYLFFLVLPVFFIFLLGGGLASAEQSESSIAILTVDEDQSALSAELLASVIAQDTVESRQYSREEGLALFDEQAAPALLIIPSGFESNLLNGDPVVLDFRRLADNSDGLIAEQAVLSASISMSRSIEVASLSLTELERYGAIETEVRRSALFSEGMALASALFERSPDLVRMTRPEEAMQGEDQGFDQASQATSGQLITWVFVPLLGTSGILAYERQVGTLRRLMTTPTRTSTYLAGTLFGQLALAGVQMSLLLLFGAWVMGVHWGNDPVALVALLLSFALAAVAFGTMLGSFVKTDGQASSVSIMAGMAMALLGGCWYPMELFPQAAQQAVKVLPTTWAMQGLMDLAARGKGLTDVALACAVLLGFAVVFFVIGVWRFRYE